VLASRCGMTSAGQGEEKAGEQGMASLEATWGGAGWAKRGRGGRGLCGVQELCRQLNFLCVAASTVRTPIAVSRRHSMHNAGHSVVPAILPANQPSRITIQAMALPSRCRQAVAEAGVPSEDPPTHLCSLPDDLLVWCLAPLSQWAR